MSYLIPIQPLSSDNLSGLKYIRIIRSADVSEFPEIYEGIAQEQIAFVAGRSWVEWVATYTTSSFSSRSEDSQEGMASVKELPFVIPQHSGEITRMMAKAERDTFVILFEDFNGVRWLFGSKEKPVRFAFDIQSGNGRDRNQYACRFYSDSPGNLAIYPHTLGEGETDFSSCPSVVIRRGATTGPIIGIVPAGGTMVITSPYSFGYFIATS
jgi:hypothetical protein